MALVGPAWWHHHGMKVSVEDFDPHCRTLRLAGSAARAMISMFSPGLWKISWVIRHSDGEVTGQVYMSEAVLRSAFGLTEEAPGNSMWLLERFGADAASQGQFIRKGNYLNIPCPGTGNDGDPNVSIELDDEIRKTVRKLLQVNC